MDITPFKIHIHYTKHYWYVEIDILGYAKTLRDGSRSLFYACSGSEGKPELQLLWFRVL